MMATVQKLKNISLVTSTDDKIKVELNKIGPMGVLMFKMDKGRAVYRSVKLEDESAPYDNKNRISYNPNPAKYGRCQLPGEPVFYGSITTSRRTFGALSADDFNSSAHGYLINLFECSDLVTDLSAEGTESYCVGMWQAQTDFEILDIINGEPDANDSPALIAEYQRMCAEMSPQEIKSQKSIRQFLADEFAKSVSYGKEHEYKITANYSGMALKKAIGIKYPSVKAQKDGYNVALNKMAIDQEILKLTRVAHVKVYKAKGDLVFYNWVGNAEYIDGKALDFKPIPGVSLSGEILKRKLDEMNMGHLF